MGKSSGYQRRMYGRGPHRHQFAHRKRSSKVKEMLLGAVAFAAIAFTVEVGPLLVGCGIKGNISYNTGEHIYHVLGQKYYWQTQINFFKGERYFCSEEAAREAGWRKAWR